MKTLPASLALLILLLPAVALASALERAATLSALKDIRSSELATSVKLSAGGGDAKQLSLGAPLTWRVLADRDGYLTLLRVDSHGVVQVVLPSGLDAAIQAGETKVVPGEGEDPLQVSAPTGDVGMFALVTERPVTLDALGLKPGDARFAVVDAPDAAAFVGRLADVAGEAHVLATSLTPFEVAGGLDPESIVAYFTAPETRALRRPSLDVYINFEFDSAKITKDSEPTAEAIAEALRDPSLKDSYFIIGGHADDVGTEAYNLDLSKRRAASTRAFLVKHGVDASRFEVEGFGEDKPLVEGTSDEARAKNRRVEFILKR